PAAPHRRHRLPSSPTRRSSDLASLSWYTSGQFMELDLTARRNLELTETLRTKEKKGSLLWVLDKTRTAMGHRLIRAWMERPLLSDRKSTRLNSSHVSTSYAVFR